MKSNKIITILFLLTLSLSNFGQTYKVQSVTKGIDFNEYSSSNRNYLERVIDVIKNSNITVKEGDLGIVSMKDGGMNFIFRFYRSANMFAMSNEDYLKVTEFNGTSNFINGISYLEMSVVRKSNVITSGEIRFYPNKYSKQAFSVKFLNQNKTSSINSENARNLLAAQNLALVNIDLASSVLDSFSELERIDNLKQYLTNSVIKIEEFGKGVRIETTNAKDGDIVWNFSRISGGDKICLFHQPPANGHGGKDLFVTKESGVISSVQLGYYLKEGDKESSIFIFSPKNKVKLIDYPMTEIEGHNDKTIKDSLKFEVVKVDFADSNDSTVHSIYSEIQYISFYPEEDNQLRNWRYGKNWEELQFGDTYKNENFFFNGKNYFKYDDGLNTEFLTFEKDKTGNVVSAKIEVGNSFKIYSGTIYLKKLFL